MNSKFRLLISFVGILLLYFYIGQQNILPLRPQSVHQWAQCDRASVAKIFSENGFDIFHPTVNNLDNGSGITGMEFPFVNFCVAILYKIFGFHEYLYRLFVLMLYTLGLMSLVEIGSYFLKNFWLAFLVMLLFAATPLLNFYAANFIPDIVSLSFLFLSWNSLLNYFKQHKSGIPFWAIYFCIAALIKITVLIFIPLLFLCLFLDDQLKYGIKKYLFVTILSVIPVFTWYIYASWLSKSTGSEIFLLQFAPLHSLNEFLAVFNEVREVWIDRLFGFPITVLLFFLPLFLVFFNRIDRSLRLIALSIMFAEVIFLILMWTQMRHHDYYAITLSLVFFISMILIVKYLMSYKIPMLIIGFILVGCVSLQANRAKSYLELAYDRQGWTYGSTHYDLYFDAEEQLRNVGIKKDDKVISFIDNSPNISLYLIHQPGVNVSLRNPMNNIQTYINSGVFKYLIVNPYSYQANDSLNLSNLPITFYCERNGLKIYNVNSYNSKKTVVKFNFSPWN